MTVPAIEIGPVNTAKPAKPASGRSGSGHGDFASLLQHPASADAAPRQGTGRSASAKSPAQKHDADPARHQHGAKARHDGDATAAAHAQVPVPATKPGRTDLGQTDILPSKRPRDDDKSDTASAVVAADPSTAASQLAVTPVPSVGLSLPAISKADTTTPAPDASSATLTPEQVAVAPAAPTPNALVSAPSASAPDPAVTDQPAPTGPAVAIAATAASQPEAAGPARPTSAAPPIAAGNATGTALLLALAHPGGAAPPAALPAPSAASGTRTVGSVPRAPNGGNVVANNVVANGPAAAAGTGLAQPPLFAALQAQDQGTQPAAAPTSGTTPPTSADSQAPDTDTDASLPASLFPAPADAARPADAAAALLPDSQPGIVASTGDHKSAITPSDADLGTAAPALAAQADPASPAAPGLATTTASAPGQTAATATPAAPSSPTPPPTLPAVQLALAITRNIGSDTQSFTLQLKPERLGSVEVKLELDAKGHATANFIADRPDTLALLRQDAHHLVQSLNDAGVNADASSLNFSLRDSGGSFSEAQERRNHAGQFLRQAGAVTQTDNSADPTPSAYRGSAASRLYDIRA